MFETDIERMLIGLLFIFWLSYSFSLREKIKEMDGKLDHISKCFEGLREYLYEKDPQFNDERHLLNELHDSEQENSINFSGKAHLDLIQEKKAAGRRTLNTQFFE